MTGGERGGARQARDSATRAALIATLLALAVFAAALASCSAAAPAGSSSRASCLGLGGEWPSNCWRPFGPRSPFNMKLPRRPRLAPGSTRVVSQLLRLSEGRGPAELEVFQDGRGGEPTYWSRPGDPWFTVHCTKPWGRCPLEGVRIQAPAGAVPEGGAGAPPGSELDAHMTIADRRNGLVYELWQVRDNALPAHGGPLVASWSGVNRLHGSGVWGRGDADAARFSELAGRVRAEEMAAGKIEHALFVVVPCDNGRFVFPARSGGASCEPRTGPPMGARLQLDYSRAEIEALPVPSWKKTLLRAMSEYGMFVGDTGTGNLFSIERESGLQYTSMGQPDRWLAFALENHLHYWGGEGGVYLGDIASGIDWGRLRVIAPCVSSRTC
jgi:hypothetical protein